MDWFRYHTSTLNNRKIQTMPRRLTLDWLNFMCLQRINISEQGRPFLPPIEDIAFRLHYTTEKAASVRDELIKLNLIDRNEDGTFSMHDWYEWQRSSDDTAVRKRRQRERQACDTSRDKGVTCPTVEVDREREVDENRENHYAPTGAFALISAADNGSVVRPVIPSRKTKKNRSLEEIRKDLGIRLPWFESLCSVHPAGRDGVKAAAEAFERKVTPDESGHQVAQAMYRGAKAYAERCAADPTAKVKWMQGWINDERWLDENKAREPPFSHRERSFVSDVEQVIGQRIAETGKPW